MNATTNLPPTLEQAKSLMGTDTTNTLNLMDLSERENYPWAESGQEPENNFLCMVDPLTKLDTLYMCHRESPAWNMITDYVTGLTLGFPDYFHARTTVGWEFSYHKVLNALETFKSNTLVELMDWLSAGIFDNALMMAEKHPTLESFIDTQFGTIYNGHIAVFDAIGMFTTGSLPDGSYSAIYRGGKVDPYNLMGACELAVAMFEDFVELYEASSQSSHENQKARKPQSKKAIKNAQRKASKTSRKK